jgi:hypothetical protein
VNCTYPAGSDVCCRCGVKSPWPHLARNCRPGLGDMLHAGLAAVGITPDRVAAALGVEDCGCEERRQLLNRAGYAIGIGTPLDTPATMAPTGEPHGQAETTS